MTKLLVNHPQWKVLDEVKKLAHQSSYIQLASAFFSEEKLLNQLADEEVEIELVVSLRPPTNYYSLKSVLAAKSIEPRFLGKAFHSKFFIFWNKDGPFAAIIGSSNFTQGSLLKNLETNLVIRDSPTLALLSNHFKELREVSCSLTPKDLEQYKKLWELFEKRREMEKRNFLNFRQKC